ncbi:MAG: universal stress protein [Planctomycetes bacterium]|nr:universal stress protein [Planctomycetota bacterium]
MFERILMPVDGSLRSELILGQLGRLLRREGSRVLLLRVLGFDDPGREEAGKCVDDLAKRYSGRGARIDGRVTLGKPAEEILRTAETEKSSMIAMTSHGRTGLSRWIQGSVAEKVARASKVPLLIVPSFPPGPPATAEELAFRKILVPTDGSRAAEAAVAPAAELARFFKSEILVLHAEFPFILPGPEYPSFPEGVPTPPLNDEATGGPAELFRAAGIKVTRATEIGDPSGVILDQCRSAGADLIALATHGRSGVKRWVLGSVAERVLRHAETPLLLVPMAAAKPKKSGLAQRALRT